MKGVSRSKFLLCLRPPDHLEGRGASVASAITYTEPGDGCSVEPVTCTQKRTLPRAARAVLYQIILSKRIRNKKGLRSPNLTNSSSLEGSSSPSSSSSYTSDENKRETLEDQGTKPNSASESTKQPKSFPRESTKQTAAKQSFLDSSALLFLISLAITVLWGKLCAILFTSIWLYFLSHPRGVSGNRPNDLPAETRLNESKSGGSYNKKRVIMEGMLERNHRRAETYDI